MPDQMRGDCLSILNHPVVRTPQMDQIARDGALFRRAYSPALTCALPLCAIISDGHPARAQLTCVSGGGPPNP